MRKVRRHPDLLVSPNAWPSTHAAWIDLIDEADDLGTDRERIAEYAADVVETLFVRPSAVGGALSRFGQRLGGEGWSLEQVSRWIDRLADVCTDPPENYLRSFASGVSLAHGWTKGNLRGHRADECFDGVTGLCTPAVLRLRLQQAFEQCAAFDLEPILVHRIVIIDADIADISALEADAVMIVLADLVQRRFNAGQTISRDGGRIFVLVDDDVALADQLSELVDEARTLSLLHAAHTLAWVEDLPEQATDIDRFLADLSA